MKPYPNKKPAHAGNRYELDAEQLEWFMMWFPKTENAKVARAMGVSMSTMHRLARLYGLKKSKSGLHQIMRRQAKVANRTKERNGYYASLRGRKPSEACRRDYQEYLKSDRYKHPLHILKERNPWKYVMRLKAVSAHRKALIRREKARVIYGLPMKTKMYRMVTIKPYTKRQTAHRHSALKRGYILMIECHEGSGERWNIYYDQDTQRAPIFERNCIKDGFKFLEYTE